MEIPHEILTTIAVSIFGSSGFWLIVQKIIESKSAMRQMVLGIGFERLTSACHKHIKEGWISIEDLEDLDKYLYQPYKHMGGNGTAELLMEKVNSLPNVPPEE